jgi:hypothetical protein
MGRASLGLVLAVILFLACGGTGSTDLFTGSSSSTTSASASSSNTAGSTGGMGGAGTSSTTSSAATVGQGGAGGCLRCSTALTQNVTLGGYPSPATEWCAGSQPLWLDVIQCGCVGVCYGSCFTAGWKACTSNLGAMPASCHDCLSLQGSTCSVPWDACLSDDGTQGQGGAGGGCQPGYLSCVGKCTDVQNDPGHCGTCKHKCAVGQTCVGGTCMGEVTTTATGGAACNAFCDGCGCPSAECSACCSAQGKADVCTNGVCGCF